eukprot:5575448-Prymnesium_polylepis.2
MGRIIGKARDSAPNLTLSRPMCFGHHERTLVELGAQPVVGTKKRLLRARTAVDFARICARTAVALRLPSTVELSPNAY